jgi:RimJ/RimL family protein N-acetyltransferase
MEKILDTERLSLRMLTHSDASFILKLVNTPGWLEFIGDKKIRNEQDAVLYLQNGPLKSYSTHGFGLWLVQLKASDTPIGLCGLLKREYLSAPDIGFAFLPTHTGKGYAFEIAKATRDYATTSLGIHTLQAITLPYNERSIKLLEKIGLRFAKPMQTPGDPTELHLYQSKMSSEVAN